MASLNVVNLKNEKVGTLSLADSVFSAKVNQPLILQVLKAQLAGKRQGTASTKTKGLVRGGGKKPFKQKGTGNSRQGSSRSPLSPGGGSTFGPLPRSYKQRTPKEMVRGALRGVLSDKFKEGKIIVLENLKVSPKTKDFASLLGKTFLAPKSLVVDSKENKNLWRAVRNLQFSAVTCVENVTVYDLLKYEWLFISSESVKQLDGVLKV